MYNEAVKPLLKEARKNNKKITDLTKELETTLKNFKKLNASFRHPIIVEKLQLTCKKKLKKDGVRNVD